MADKLKVFLCHASEDKPIVRDVTVTSQVTVTRRVQE